MLVPQPYRSSIDDRGGSITEVWRRWFQRVADAASQAPQVVAVANLSAQAASLTTSIMVGSAPNEANRIYRITYSARVTRAASTSSSLVVTPVWTEGGIAQSSPSAALVGNLTTSYLTGTLLVRVEDAGTIDVQTTYGSVGATSLQYRLDVVVEALPGLP